MLPDKDSFSCYWQIGGGPSLRHSPVIGQLSCSSLPPEILIQTIIRPLTGALGYPQYEERTEEGAATP